MQPVSPVLLQYLSTLFQIGDRSPKCAVVIVHPVTGEHMQIDRVLSIDIDRRHDTPASEFRFVADNTGGWLSPDYSHKKFLAFPDMRGVPNGNPWGKVLWPNTQVHIHVGYGEEVRRVFTGLIDSIELGAEEKTITVSGRSMYKRVLVETPPKKIVYKNKTVKFIVVDVHKRLGLNIDAEEIYELGGTTPYVVPELEIERGSKYDAGISDLITSTYARVESDPLGWTRLRPVRVYRGEAADVVIDEAVNLTSLGYQISDFDLYTHLTIKSGEKGETFTDKYLRDMVCAERGHTQYREEVLELPWAKTSKKKKQAALAYFRRLKQQMRTVTFGIVGNPTLELYDIANIREHISTATSMYIIKGIRTTFGDEGYFELIDAEAL
jgi:hypothetical protein